MGREARAHHAGRQRMLRGLRVGEARECQAQAKRQEPELMSKRLRAYGVTRPAWGALVVLVTALLCTSAAAGMTDTMPACASGWRPEAGLLGRRLVREEPVDVTLAATTHNGQ